MIKALQISHCVFVFLWYQSLFKVGTIRNLKSFKTDITQIIYKNKACDLQTHYIQYKVVTFDK
jgi:hypothetical protein